MRTIKFRGKRVDGGGWIYGDLINSMSKTFIGLESDERNPLGDRYYLTIEVIPETVGQFTGLTDKNGVEIYEGDECKCTFENAPTRLGIVKWSDKDWEFSIEDDEPDDLHLYWLTVEVIGNIHDQ